MSDGVADITLTEAWGCVTTAERINALHTAAQEHALTALECARRCGDLLTFAKSEVKHGEWLSWLKANTTVSPRTAQLYMQVAANAEKLQANTQQVAHLGLQKAIRWLAQEEKRQAITIAAAEHEAVAPTPRAQCEDRPPLPADVAKRLDHLRRRRAEELAMLAQAERNAEEEAQQQLLRRIAALRADAQPRLDRIDDEIEALEESGDPLDIGQFVESVNAAVGRHVLVPA